LRRVGSIVSEAEHEFLEKRRISILVYSNDHDPPHVDVRKGKGKMKIYLSIGQGMPRMGPRNRFLSDVDARRAFELCCESHGEMSALWEAVHGKTKDK